MCLRYRGEVRLIADEVLRLSFGRDAESDFVIHDRRASRHHARVERRAGGRWVLIDSMGEFIARQQQAVLDSDS